MANNGRDSIALDAKPTVQILLGHLVHELVDKNLFCINLDPSISATVVTNKKEQMPPQRLITLTHGIQIRRQPIKKNI